MGVWVTSGRGDIVVGFVGITGQVGVSPDGAPPSYFGGPGMGVGQFTAPGAVTAVPGLGVIVADSGNNRLQLLSMVAISTHPVTTAVVPGSRAALTVATAFPTAGLTYTWKKCVRGQVPGAWVCRLHMPALCTPIARKQVAERLVVQLVSEGDDGALVGTGCAGHDLAEQWLVSTDRVRSPVRLCAAHERCVLYVYRDGVAIGTNSPTYQYTGLDADVGHVFSIACTVSHPLGAADSSVAALVVQVGAAGWPPAQERTLTRSDSCDTPSDPRPH
jgi:hypothetical protein